MKTSSVIGLCLYLAALVLLAGCSEKSTPIDVTPPVVAITYPADGAVVSDSVTIKASVTENDALEKVSFLIDGTAIAAFSEGPFEHLWYAFNWADGNQHILSQESPKAPQVVLTSQTHHKERQVAPATAASAKVVGAPEHRGRATPGRTHPQAARDCVPLRLRVASNARASVRAAHPLAAGA